MRDKSLSDDALKLVRYRILFVKRGYEAVLAHDSSLVHDNLAPEDFVAWKISEFSRRLAEVPVPPAWGGTASDRPRYPLAATRTDSTWYINKLDPDDEKYLRVSYEVINRSTRERFEYEEDQVAVLRQIRDNLDKGGSRGGGASSAASPASGGSPAASSSRSPSASSPASAPAAPGSPSSSQQGGGGAQGWYVS